mmetsp:Transcript_23570/g.51219  ORF Transcript_23570/g.51219 Transcript_23570/m.51219 type:complete len:1253 (-) Transcript_23570:17-3775(-)
MGASHSSSSNGEQKIPELPVENKAVSNGDGQVKAVPNFAKEDRLGENGEHERMVNGECSGRNGYYKEFKSSDGSTSDNDATENTSADKSEVPSDNDSEIEDFVDIFVKDEEDNEGENEVRFDFASEASGNLKDDEIDEIIERFQSDIMELSLPQAKLESISHAGLFSVALLLICVWLYSFISLLVLQLVSSDTTATAFAFYFVQGFTNTLSVCILVFLFVSFVPRIIARSCQRKRVMPQQVLIAVPIVLNVAMPDSGPYSTYDYWNQFNEAVQLVDHSDAVFGQNFTENPQLPYQIVFHAYDPSQTTASDITSLVMFCVFYLFWYTMLNVCRYFTVGIIAKLQALEFALLEKSKHIEHTRMFRSVGGSATAFSVSEEEGDRPETRRVGDKFKSMVTNTGRAVLAETGTKIKKLSDVRQKVKCCSMYYICGCFLCCDRARCGDSTSSRGVIRRGFSVRMCLFLIMYLIVYIVVGGAYSYNPSTVPFIGIVTVIRVCVSKNPDNLSWCSPSLSTYGFQRAWCCVALFFIELILFAWIFNITNKVLNVLKKVPYSYNRANFLGFSYIYMSIAIFWLMLYSLALIEVLQPSVETWVWSFRLKNSTLGPEEANLEPYANPLFTTGVQSSSNAYPAISLLTSTFFLIMAYAYLPPDSVGCRGWFAPSRQVVNVKTANRGNVAEVNGQPLVNDSGVLENPLPADNQSVASGMTTLTAFSTINEHEDDLIDEQTLRRYYDENPLYLYAESEFDRLLNREGRGIAAHFCGVEAILEEGEVLNTDGTGEDAIELITLQTSKSRAMSAEFSADTDLEDLSYDYKAAKQRMSQIQSHVLVLDTEILLFNFAAITYCMGTEQRPLSHEKEQKLIGNDEFILVKHIVDKESDTHVFVCVSPDRVVITFRGTVSSSNVKTDLDYNLEVFDEARKVKPLPSTHMIERRAMDKPPRVHAGFLAAYRTIEMELKETIAPFIFIRNHNTIITGQKRGVYITGHSLGGGLGIICALSLSLHIEQFIKTRAAVCCTSFGCPRIGSYSFVQRYKRVVPTTKRFVLASDVVPKTPPRVGKGPFSGFHHVGCELMLDLEGNMLIAPNVAERFILHGLRRPTRKTHFCSRYALGLILWATRMKADADVWITLVNRMVKFAKYDISQRDQALIRSSTVFFKEGVIWKLGDKEIKNTGCQTQYRDQEPVDDFDDEVDETDSLLAHDNENHHPLLTSFDQLNKHLQEAKTNKEPLSLDQIDDMIELVQQSRTRFTNYYDT